MQSNNPGLAPIVISKKKHNRKWNRKVQNSDSESGDTKKLRRHNSQHTRHNRMEETEERRARYRRILDDLDFRYKLLRNKYGDTILKNNKMMDFILSCKDYEVFEQYASYLNENDRKLFWHYIKLNHYFLVTFHQHIKYVADKAHTMSVPKMKEHIRALRAYIEYAQQYFKDTNALQCAKNENDHSQSEAEFWSDWSEGELPDETSLNNDKPEKKELLSRPERKTLSAFKSNTKDAAFFPLVNTKFHLQRDSRNFSPQMKRESPEIEIEAGIKTSLFKRSNHITEEDLPPASCLIKDYNSQEIAEDRDEVKDVPFVADVSNSSIQHNKDVFEDEFNEEAMITELRNTLNIFAEHALCQNNKPFPFINIHRALNLFEKEKSKNQELKTSQPVIPAYKTISFFGSKDKNVVPDEIKLYQLTRRRTMG